MKPLKLFSTFLKGNKIMCAKTEVCDVFNIFNWNANGSVYNDQPVRRQQKWWTETQCNANTHLSAIFNRWQRVYVFVTLLGCRFRKGWNPFWWLFQLFILMRAIKHLNCGVVILLFFACMCYSACSLSRYSLKRIAFRDFYFASKNALGKTNLVI